MTGASKTVVPMLVVALMLILDLSAGVSAMIPEEDNINDLENHISEIPELMCQGEVCPEKFLGVGFPPWDARTAVESPYWWVDFSTDQDSNGMEDSLQYMIDGQKESHSATAILGDDGRMTTAIIVGYSWHPGETDLENLKHTEFLDDILVKDVIQIMYNDYLPKLSIVLLENF